MPSNIFTRNLSWEKSIILFFWSIEATKLAFQKDVCIHSFLIFTQIYFNCCIPQAHTHCSCSPLQVCWVIRCEERKLCSSYMSHKALHRSSFSPLLSWHYYMPDKPIIYHMKKIGVSIMALMHGTLKCSFLLSIPFNFSWKVWRVEVWPFSQKT